MEGVLMEGVPMRRTASLFVLLLSLSLLAAKSWAQERSPTPPEQLAALKKEYDIPTGSPRPLTDAERMQFIGRVYRHHSAVASKLVDLAEKDPRSSVALDALTQAVWQVNGNPWPVDVVGEDPARARAFTLLFRDHTTSDRIGPLCQRIAYGFAREYETFLRAVRRKNPHRDVQAAACISLARFLSNRRQRVALCREQPALAQEFAALFGEEYLAGLLRQDRRKASAEIETLFTQASRDFGDAKLPDGGVVAEVARAELLAIRTLGIGKQAPEIEGEDQDGKHFRLSDYRGKVVLLDFWSWV